MATKDTKITKTVAVRLAAEGGARGALEAGNKREAKWAALVSGFQRSSRGGLLRRPPSNGPPFAFVAPLLRVNPAS